MKQFKSLDEQIDYLHDNKSIEFQDRDTAKNILLDCNYYNLISCGKVKFALDINKKSHVYEKHDFIEWCDYFDTDCRVSEYLMSNLIEFERIINSRTAFYVGELIEKDILTVREYNEIVEIIRNADVENLDEYIGKETWKYISKMTFGKMKNILFWLLKDHADIYKKIISGYSFIENGSDVQIKNRINDIILLRNYLFHFTPLNLYLVYAMGKWGQLDNRFRIKVVNFILNLNPNDMVLGQLKDMIIHSNNFIKIKNSQQSD